MRHILALLCAIAVAWIAPAAHAEKRVALVIGNSAYQNTAELRNPKNDAGDMAAALRRLGFEVIEGQDLDKRSMERLIRQYAIKLAAADLALFFYAGHGLQVGGQNYLIPIDAKLASEGDVDFESLPMTLVIKQMEREAKTSIVLLDACRDNPLARNLARSLGTRSIQIGQGLAPVQTGVGTLIGFSTQPGNVAMDGTGRNSPYTEALLQHLESPDREVSAVLVAVRNDVLKTTAGRQVPWEHTSLTGQVFLKLGASQAPAGALPPSAMTAPSYDKELEIAFWNTVKDSKSPAVIETYLQRYPNGTFSGLAGVLITQLKDGQAKPATGPAKLSSLPSGSEQAPQALPAGNPVVLARALQKELQRVGCDPGAADGKWGANAKDALAQFARLAKMTVPTDEPTQAALDAVSARKDRVCPLQCDKGETEVNGSCMAKAAPDRRARPSTERASRKEVTRRKAPDSKEPPSKGGGMCWTQSRNALVSCSDARAGARAY